MGDFGAIELNSSVSLTEGGRCLCRAMSMVYCKQTQCLIKIVFIHKLVCVNKHKMEVILAI